ncbi:hypothetical protein [Gaetbulibacter saemankumensis]|uniref:hypothetical protein n=1 Tax=Gaetbulibacter saemankumensis TaxID=311208 RepID=UPI0012FBA976|nr:hypothetical protein [Gaetbulibacter saemankumensis]
MLPKIFIEVGAIFLILKKGIKDKKLITYLLMLIGLSAISMVNIPFNLNDIFDKLYVLNKYLFLSVFAVAFLSFEEDIRIKIIIQIRNTILVLGIINGLFMVFGLISQWEILKAYPNTHRFGYNGFLLKTSEASYLYILLIITTYYDYFLNKKNGILCLYFVAISFFLGTKAVWLFVTLLVSIHFLLHKKKQLRYIYSICIMTCFLVFYFFNDFIIRTVVSLFSFGPEIYNKHGFITFITSTRDLLLINTLNHLKEYGTYIIYFFGGINLKNFGVEFEFVDLFLFFGAFGLIVYILIIKRLFFTEYTKIKLLVFLALMCVAFFAGNFFVSFICSLFAYAVFKYMDYLNRINI